VKQENTLRDFLINRFGKELYSTFFQSYTEKVWGVPCEKIKAEWGAQRIKDLSLSKAILAFFVKDPSLEQRKTSTSLIQRFLYPKYGPGQMWEEVANQITALGGKIILNKKIIGLHLKEGGITSADVRDEKTGDIENINVDYFFSTMPVKELIANLHPKPPEIVVQTAAGLIYRDFITVGVLVNKGSKAFGKDRKPLSVSRLQDTWIYIQEKDVRVGRLQIFNNWSPYLVKDPQTLWVGMEYFCNEGDELWNKTEAGMLTFAISELHDLGLIDEKDVLDGTVVKMLKTYPAYLGSYDHFNSIREFTDNIENLFLIGRNGMHRYNNQDHSMLTAMTAVDNIREGITSKDNIWNINTDDSYQEA